MLEVVVWRSTGNNLTSLYYRVTVLRGILQGLTM
jgi:hypothetical protein